MPLDEQSPRPPAGLTEPLWAWVTHDPAARRVVIVPDDSRDAIVVPAELGANLDRLLAHEGWEATLGPSDPSPVWKHGEGDTQVARAVCYPRPDREAEEIADLIGRYGSRQVAFGAGPSLAGAAARTFLRVGVDRDALGGDGETVTLSLADPADMIAERVRRVMAEADRLAWRDHVPVVVTLAEVLRGALDHDDRPRQIAAALDLKPWRRVQQQLMEWASLDGAATARTVTTYSTEYLDWLLDSYRGLPEGPSHGEAIGLYPEPFPPSTVLGELGSVGAREVVLAACAAVGVHLDDLPAQRQDIVAGTYRHYRSESWLGVLVAEERARRKDWIGGGLADHDPGDAPVERGTAVWDRATGQVTISLDDCGEPVVLEHGDLPPHRLADTLLTQGWVTYQGEDGARSGYHWAHLSDGREHAWVLRYPLPAGHDEHLEELLTRYGRWQVAFRGAEAPGPDVTLTCTVGETRQAWRAGGTVVLEIADPNRQALARARAVRTQAARTARDRDEPLVLSLAELVRGALDPTDRGRQIADTRAAAPRDAVRTELARLGATDGTANAAALPSRSSGYLAWVLDTFRAWPAGDVDGDAAEVYPQPFTMPADQTAAAPQGAREILRVACAACGADLVEFTPSEESAMLDAYLVAHRTAWIIELRARHSRSGQ